jgi:hypothetical protein
MRSVLLTLLALAAAAHGQRHNLPILPAGPNVGVVYGQANNANISDRSFDELVRAGATSISIIFEWSDIEPVRGWW